MDSSDTQVTERLPAARVILSFSYEKGELRKDQALKKKKKKVVIG